MKVDRLALKNFRNIEDSIFYPDPKVNFLVGSNGQGKTSFIEALGVLSTLRSFRDSKPSALVRWGTQQSDISCTLTTSDKDGEPWKTDLRLTFQTVETNPGKVTKTAFINDKPYRSSTQYLSQRFGSYELGFHTIIFNPSDHDLVRGEPAIRRSYLDRAIAAEDVEYLKTSQKYHRVLEQRNALLRTHDTFSREAWISFTQPLCQYGAYLALKRMNWIWRLNPLLNQALKRIAPTQPELKLSYVSQWVPKIENLSINNNKLESTHFAGQGPLPSLELLEQWFWTQVSVFEAAERKIGHSLVGPHRDDWTFFLGNQVLKGHGSQGEVRSALLALKLSEIELFRNETGHRPLFLLDDFSSELDQKRRSFLLQFLMETDLQTFVTTTEDSTFVGKRYWVMNGTVNGAVEEGKHDHRAKAI